MLTTMLRRIVGALSIGLPITLAAACAHQGTSGSVSASPSTSSPWALPTSTMRWNDQAWELVARNRIGQFPAIRTFAYTNLAINNAIILARQQGRGPAGAAAGAAATVLIFLFPKDEQALTARLARETAAIGVEGHADFAAGVEIGRAAAADVIAAAKNDRSGAPWTGSLPTGPDKWVSQNQPPTPPLGPGLGGVRTFFLTTGADFRPPTPPAVDSQAFKAQVAEVRKVSDHRTPEQLRIAQYWENLTAAFAAGLWKEVARDAISARGLGELESARVLALMHMASADANIVCHDAKYTYWVPRPTQMDPGIRLAIGVPNHPSYPSNHACVSGTIGLVLDAQFPEQKGRFFAMGRQAGESRIYAGIHYPFDVEDGFTLARKVAAKVLQVGIPTDRPFMPLGR